MRIIAKREPLTIKVVEVQPKEIPLIIIFLISGIIIFLLIPIILIFEGIVWFAGDEDSDGCLLALASPVLLPIQLMYWIWILNILSL